MLTRVTGPMLMCNMKHCDGLFKNQNVNTWSHSPFQKIRQAKIDIYVYCLSTCLHIHSHK